MRLVGFGAVVAAIALCSSGERDKYCKINYIYLVEVANFRNYDVLVSESNSIRRIHINGICVGVSRAAGETICQGLSLLYVYMTEGVPLSIAKCRGGQTVNLVKFKYDR
jgi:hypothetical protein